MKSKRMRASASVQQRAKELRLTMTLAERILWERLRARRLAGIKFRRQHPIIAYIVDFYCAAARLVIEIDGGIHHQQAEADANRSRELEDQGYQVLRFTNVKVETKIENVLSVVQAACQSKTPRPYAGEGQG
jgi:very-short-patch-repair endonuclease